MRRAWLLWIAVAFVASSGVVRTQAQKPLDIYFIDVEGGQSTLFVSPSGESLLVDAGSPGARDADRIVATAKSAGLTQIDYLVVTHYDSDHVGGAKDVGERMPIRTFVDHGPRLPGEAFGAGARGGGPGGAGAVGGGYQAMVDRVDGAYAEARAKGRHIEVKVGDKVPVAGLDIQVVSAQGNVLTSPLAGAGTPNPLCQSYTAKDVDKTENVRSVGMMIRLGRFRMLDLGDLTWTKEHDLVCPNNLLGTVDLYLTTHHGLAISGPRAIVHAVRPRVTVMNNGPRKGGSRETWTTVKSSPGLEDLWQLHYSVPRPPNASYQEALETGGKEFNAPEDLIANLDEAAGHTPAYAIKVSARQDGGFVVTNLRNGFSKEYKAPTNQAAAAQALPMPKFHHIHLNSVNPAKSLDWYAKYWPAGKKTTVAGFPAFSGSDIFLLYTKVDKQAPGAFRRDLRRSVPPSAFWTFGSTVADTKGLYERLAANPKDFEFLTVFSGPDDTKGVPRSSLLPFGDQLLTLTQIKERADRQKAGQPPPPGPAGNQDFGYFIDPDGMLVEFNSGSADNFWGHNHYWHEQPLCAANWYAEHLGMQLSAVRDPATGQMVPRAKWDPCDVPIGEVSYPTFIQQGQLRIPIGNVRFANGGWSWYTRQCRDGRCGPGNDKTLAPSRGQVVDHVALAYPNLDAVIAQLEATGVPIVKGPYKFGDGRAIMIEDPDHLSLELIELAQ